MTGWEQDGSSGVLRRGWFLNSYVDTIETAGFVDGIDTRYEKKREESRMTSRFLA